MYIIKRLTIKVRRIREVWASSWSGVDLGLELELELVDVDA